MPRLAIIDAHNASHHIILRGIEWSNFFLEDADRESFFGSILEV